MIVQMIILTKSFKHHEFCIAGINVQDGRWIRLVTDNDNTEGAVPYEDAQYDNGNPVEVLDCVEVDLIRHVPTQAQKEN